MLLTLFNSIQRRNHHPQRTEQSVNTTELNNTRYLVRTGFRTRPVLYRVPGTGTGTVMGLVPTVPGTRYRRLCHTTHNNNNNSFFFQVIIINFFIIHCCIANYIIFHHRHQSRNTAGNNKLF